MISETRRALSATLTTELGFTVHPVLDERLSPPVGFIIPGSPFVEGGATFGAFGLRLECHLVFQGTNNRAASDAIDDAVETALVTLVNAGWSVESASEPFLMTHAGSNYMAVQLSTTKDIHL
jgi:hypothetical protein